LFPKELEPVFYKLGKSCTTKITLIIYKGFDYAADLKIKKESMEVIEKFKEMGIIKKFDFP